MNRHCGTLCSKSISLTCTMAHRQGGSPTMRSFVQNQLLHALLTKPERRHCLGVRKDGGEEEGWFEGHTKSVHNTTTWTNYIQVLNLIMQAKLMCSVVPSLKTTSEWLFYGKWAVLSSFSSWTHEPCKKSQEILKWSRSSKGYTGEENSEMQTSIRKVSVF